MAQKLAFFFQTRRQRLSLSSSGELRPILSINAVGSQESRRFFFNRGLALCISRGVHEF
jgi:hypothetical protein